MIKRCVSLSLAVLLLAMLTAPALANAGDQPVTSTGTFWSHVAANTHSPYLNSVIGFLDPSVCTVSDDGRHHGKVVGKGLEPGAWWAKCDLCSQRFRVYDDDMQKAYEGKVGELPSPGYTSDGHLLWPVTVSDLSGSVYAGCTYSGFSYTDSFSIDALPKKFSACFATWSLNDSRSFKFLCTGSSRRLYVGLKSFDVTVPISGNYRIVSSPSLSGRYFASSGGIVEFSADYSTSSIFLHYEGGKVYSDFRLGLGSSACFSRSSYDVNSADGIVYLPVYEIIPDSSLGSSYDIDTRVGTFSGNFGYYGDNGQMVLAENISIVNETNNTFHNPVTGDTAPVSSWTYDYGDRSYDITLDTGDTVTVTYGDEHVTIVQGGNTYNVYYIVEQGGGEPEPTPTPPPTPTPTPPVPTPTVSPGPEPTEPVDPDAPPDTSGWGILDFLKGIFDFLFGLVKKILDGLSALIQNLLQPSEESINKLQSQIEEKLPFISDLKGFGDDFANALKNPLMSAADNKYTTVVDIGAKKGGVSYGTGQVNLLDVSWYLEYKPMGDAIIEGVCWLSFLWNLYGAVPGIIHGAASGVYSTGEIKRWKDGHEE